MTRVRLGLLAVSALAGLGLLVPASAATPRQATDGTEETATADDSGRNRTLVGLAVLVAGLSVVAWVATAGSDDDESAVTVGLSRFTRVLELPKPSPPTGAPTAVDASSPAEPEVGGLGRFARARDGEAPPL